MSDFKIKPRLQCSWDGIRLTVAPPEVKVEDIEEVIVRLQKLKERLLNQKPHGVIVLDVHSGKILTP